MNRRTAKAQQLRELIGTDVAAHELRRLGRVDALLRAAAADDRENATFEADASERRNAYPSGDPARPRLSLVKRLPATRSASPDLGEQTHELTLTFAQLALVYKSLQAVKALGALPPEDALLGDTLQLVDLALTEAG